MEDRRRVWAAVAGETLRSPLCAAAWGGSLVLGTAFGLLPGALLSAAALHVTALALALRDPGCVHRALWARDARRMRRRIERLRERAASLDPTTRERLRAIREVCLAICRECTAPDLPRWARDPLAATLDQMDRLLAQTAELAARRGELGVFLEGVNRSDLQGQQAALQARCCHSADPVQKAQLAQSLRFKQEEIASYETIARALARVDGQLESLQHAFAALKARLFRFRSDEKTEWTAAGDRLDAEMNALSADVDTLNQSVREVLALRGGM